MTVIALDVKCRSDAARSRRKGVRPCDTPVPLHPPATSSYKVRVGVGRYPTAPPAESVERDKREGSWDAGEAC